MVRAVRAGVTIVWLFAFVPTPARAEVAVGITGGVLFAGDQDLAFSGTQQRVHPSPGPLGGLTVTAWGHPWLRLGFQLDVVHWENSAETDRQAAQPARLAIDQARTALLVSVLGRLPLGGDSGPFLYGGLSGGAVYSGVSHGGEGLGPAVGLLGGLAVPLTSRLRVRAEVRYLLLHDVDHTRGPGLRVETSGTARGNVGHVVFGPHLDDRIFPVLLGVDWVF